jgi:hypothetical protein
MQTFLPWGKEVFSFQLEEAILEDLTGFSQQCQSYYISIEKRRNESIDDSGNLSEKKDEILNRLEQIVEQLKNQYLQYATILDNPLMKQSLMAALVAHVLGFEYNLHSMANVDGKCEVRGVMRDLAGNKVESSGLSDHFQPGDGAQAIGSFYMASKKAFISAASLLSELDFSSKLSEVLI